MRAARFIMGAIGVGLGLWGLWLMRDFTGQQVVSTGVWLAGGILVHDAVLAPVTVGLGVLASRLLPGHFRAATSVAFLLWATLTVVFLPVLSGQGGKPGNDSILNRPYLASWLVLTGVLAGAAIIAGLRRRARASGAAATAED
ncbi:MAG: hypothetical protein P1U38_00360 [Aeromicrobium sp.]|uniref:hypothetical protein n=1 Tax=Aeromicrobium sp. TaxID=1871063 RepID=UPI0026306139|nr:hypothetical protein [Aeromicrobium sp.]MDF1703205.1 hypothetical protein [Aeromicrobium sp.]